MNLALAEVDVWGVLRSSFQLTNGVLSSYVWGALYLNSRRLKVMPFKSHLKKAKGDERNNPYIFRRGQSWDYRAVCKPYIAFHSHLRSALAFDSLGLWFDFMCSFEVLKYFMMSL